MSNMKITAVETFVVHAVRCNWVFARIQTTDGISGVGEATVEMREQTIAQAIQELGRYLIGKDPFEIEKHVHVMNRDSYWRSGVILRSALSAVEAAMFDIKGKALKVPVYELLGGRDRDRIRCYANGWFAGANKPEEFGEKAKAAKALGFKALKFDPFGKAYLQLTPAERNRAYAIVEAIRSSVGDDVELLIEAHGRFDIPTAVEMAKRLEPLRPYWYEEPVVPDSISAVAEVRKRVSFPVAFGERLFEPHRFEEAFRQEAMDIAQPDVCHTGGLIEMKRIAHLAFMHGKPVAPHNPNGPICNAMTLQLAASVPNFCFLETMLSDVTWRKDVVPEDLQMIDGELVIPERIGLGVELNVEAAAEHAYEARDLRHYNGALTNIRPTNAVPWFKTTVTEA